MRKSQLPDQLNICIISRKFPILGRTADNGFLWPIAKSMAAKGHNVTVFSAKNFQNQEMVSESSVNVHYLMEKKENKGRRFSHVARENFSNLHKNAPFHLVHSIDDSGFQIAKVRKRYKVAVAYDVEATQMAQIFSILGMAQETLGSLIRTGVAVGYKFLRTFYGKDRKLLRSADGVFVTSPIQRFALERYYLYPDARTFTVPYGIEIGNLKPKERSEELREELKIQKSTKTIVTVTDMTEFGEIKNILEAFQKIAIKKPNSRLIIVGQGPLRKKIEFETLQLALGNKVTFTGAVKNFELPDYISLGDIFVNLSARTTGFEPSMLEAMAQEKVIIGSEVSPISTIVEDGKDGFLIRPADVQNLSTLILDIFAGQIKVLEIGSSARHKVLNLFDTEKMVDETLKSYFKILLRTGYYKK